MRNAGCIPKKDILLEGYQFASSNNMLSSVSFGKKMDEKSFVNLICPNETRVWTLKRVLHMRREITKTKRWARRIAKMKS
jgi:hypothetical protein